MEIQDKTFFERNWIYVTKKPKVERLKERQKISNVDERRRLLSQTKNTGKDRKISLKSC